ncbi:hypothetical protein GJ744_003921 [Endocarpon pusillum]|uniref:Uncharacterized protein n=1 Tax=Endocarpon pusillum TaxID=364733 RepID=A0A8H7A8L4_9EURO|nr:hypothetical protein GJ744_003921 [Endocarpon pusillum]
MTTEPPTPAYAPFPLVEEYDDLQEDLEENPAEPDPPPPPSPKNLQNQRELMNQLGFNALVDKLNKKIQDIESPAEALDLMAQNPENALRLIKGLDLQISGKETIEAGRETCNQAKKHISELANHD